MKEPRTVRLAVTSLSCSIALAYASGFLFPTLCAAQTANQPVIYLNQAWSQDDREWYYHFSQGSAVLSYDTFLNLEVAGGQELFRSDANSERYGLIATPRDHTIPTVCRSASARRL
jgi:hypothetical protein